MKLLLTRPTGRNRAMQDALAAREVSCSVFPLLEIKANPKRKNITLLTQLSQADIAIFISTNAVKYACFAFEQFLPANCQIFAVGEATFDAINATGHTCIQTPCDNQKTEGLLQLAELSNIENKNIVIVRGCGGRESLAKHLTERGANVTYWETYYRTYPTLKFEQIYQWQQIEIDTIIITSGEMLQQLIIQIPPQLWDWFSQCHFVVPSQRVYEIALKKGLTHITNAHAANTQAILSALRLDKI